MPKPADFSAELGDFKSELGDVVERFDHFAVAVPDIAAALPMVELMQGRFRSGGDSTTGRFRWVQFFLPEAGKIELLQPLDGSDASHFLVRFLAERGPGLHHVTFKVRSLDAAVSRAEELGLEIVGRRSWGHRRSEAFVHPKSSNGVLVQLAEWKERPAPEGITLDKVLRGEAMR